MQKLNVNRGGMEGKRTWSHDGKIKQNKQRNVEGAIKM